MNLDIRYVNLPVSDALGQTINWPRPSAPLTPPSRSVLW